MQDPSLNQNEQLIIPQDSNQYLQPVPQTSTQPIIQIPSQPYTQPQQNFPQPTSNSEPQSNKVQLSSQQNVKNNNQPGVIFASKDFKSKLCRPRIFTWFLFGLDFFSLFYCFYYYDKLFNNEFVYTIFRFIFCITILVIAIFVDKSVINMDSQKYFKAIIINIVNLIFHAIICIFTGLVDNFFYYLKEERFENVIELTDIILNIILLIVLLLSKKEFKTLSMPNNQEIIIPL